jgi:hypothetical protein
VKQTCRVGVQILFVVVVSVGLGSIHPLMGQGASTPVYRSRAEYVAARRELEKSFPEVTRALRTLHLPPDKMREAQAKLRQSEASTRAARQELQMLEEENRRQGYDRATKSARADELRASLQRSTDQLHTEIKNLLTPQQRDQFEQRSQKEKRHALSKQKISSR